MTKKNLKIAAALILLGATGLSHAQIRPAYSYPSGSPSGGAGGPAAIQVGGTPLFVSPFIGLGVGHDDNVLLTPTNKRSSTLYITSPGFKVDARSEASVFQASYQGQIGRYQDSQDDDYIDHTLRGQYDVAFSGRQFLRLGYDYLYSHDPRGSTDRSVSTRPDKYRSWAPSATYAFGARGAQGRVELYYGGAYKTYINNRDTTQLSDRDTNSYGGAFYWRVMPKTYFLAEVRQTNIDYRSPLAPFGGEERRYYGGVSWEATAATTGTFKIGQLRRKFDSGLSSAKATSWEGDIVWAPRTYSAFDFYTSRQTNEATGLGSFILSSTYGVNWTHAWTSVLNTGVILRYQKDEFQDFNRTDKTESLGLRVGYRFRRWLTLGAEYNYTKRDSNAPTFEYDKNLYMLTATASM